MKKDEEEGRWREKGGRRRGCAEVYPFAQAPRGLLHEVEAVVGLAVLVEEIPLIEAAAGVLPVVLPLLWNRSEEESRWSGGGKEV